MVGSAVAAELLVAKRHEKVCEKLRKGQLRVLRMALDRRVTYLEAQKLSEALLANDAGGQTADRGAWVHLEVLSPSVHPHITQELDLSYTRFDAAPHSTPQGSVSTAATCILMALSAPGPSRLTHLLMAGCDIGSSGCVLLCTALMKAGSALTHVALSPSGGRGGWCRCTSSETIST
eukprot:Sspe_Gene.45383::Locus_22452_Transcript_1_6_Confidence_0.706_Length_575::g.45383::m.45383